MKRIQASISTDTYWHIYNRGFEKRLIFKNARDYERFILTIFACRAESTYPDLSRLHSKSISLEAKVALINEFVDGDPEWVDIICFCAMPNHFHLLLFEKAPGGISKFIQRVENGYTKYFNIKYDRTGYLLGSSFHRILVDRNEYLLHLSRYIHRNPIEILSSVRDLINYPWSSYQDFVIKNRWGKGLSPAVVLDQFRNGDEYKNYVSEDLREEIDPKYLLDP